MNASSPTLKLEIELSCYHTRIAPLGLHLSFQVYEFFSKGIQYLCFASAILSRNFHLRIMSSYFSSTCLEIGDGQTVL